MDSAVGGSPPDRNDPFRRSPRLSRSPTRGVGNPTHGDGISVPSVARGEHAGPQPPLTSDCSDAVEVENLAPTASTTATSQKTMDHIAVPSQKTGGKSPAGSPHRSSDLTAALQNEDLRGILTRMNGKISTLLSAFETQRHVTRETKGIASELSALNNRALELYKGTTSEHRLKSSATQTEVQKPTKKAPQNAQVPKVQVPKIQAPKPSNPTLGGNGEEKATSRPNESKPGSYASVAKNASTGVEWTKVKPTRLRKKPEALIVKKTGEASYAEMLRKLRSDPSLSELGSHVRKIRRTQKGELLLEVEGKASESVPKFKSDLEAALNDLASVRTGAQRIALSCSGLDEATTAEELHSCLVAQFQGLQINPEDIRGLRRMRDGTQIASVLLNANVAIPVLKQGTITVGWSRCRITQDVRPTRCYRCLGYGHRSATCKNTDRADCCLRCGERGHKAKGCVAAPKCLICSSEVDRNHSTGSFACPTYRATLKEAKSHLNAHSY